MTIKAQLKNRTKKKNIKPDMCGTSSGSCLHYRGIHFIESQLTGHKKTVMSERAWK